MKAEQIVLLDPSAVSNPSFGINPSNRSLEDLIRCGFILVDKPPGPSSHQLAAWVRSMLGIKRIGHGGTLDPFATGLLTLLCGRSTKITAELLKKPKRYVAILRFKESMPEDYFSEIIGDLTGDIFNVPPKESAVKIQVRSRNISESTLIQSGESGRIHLISISCEAGTYIRTLVKDIGLISGNPCELLELHRTGSGSLEDTMACTMHQLSDAIFLWKEHDDDKGLIRLISPVERILDDLPRLVIKDGAVGAISHGAPLARPGIVSMTPGVKSGSRVLLSSMKEEAVAIAELSVDSDEIPNMKSGQIATPSNVIMEPGTYPQTWSRE